MNDVLKGVGARWLEESFDLPAGEVRKAAREMRSSWQGMPEYRALQTELDSLMDAVVSEFRRTFQRPPSLADVRSAVQVNTKCKRLEAVLDSAIEKSETWVAAGRALPVKAQSLGPSPTRRKRAPPLSLEAWLAFLSAEVAAAESARLSLLGLVVAFVSAVAGLALVELTETVLYIALASISGISIVGAYAISRRYKRMKAAKRLVAEITDGKLRSPEAVARRWKELGGHRAP